MFEFLKKKRQKASPVLQGVVAPANETSSAMDLALVVPLVKVLETGDPTGSEVALSEDDSPIIRPLVVDLVVMYALDLPDRFQFISHRDLRNTGLTAEALHELALRNLPSRLPKLEIHGEPPRCMAIAGGNFEATLLLHDPLWDQLAEVMPGDLMAVAPARDLLFISGSGWPEAASFLGEVASKDLPDKKYSLSRCVLIRRDGKWHPHALV